MLFLLQEELFSFALPLPLSFLYADSARQKMARSQKEQNTRIINKLPEH